MGVTWFRQGDRSDTYKRVRSPNYVKNWKQINADTNSDATNVALAA